MDWRIVPRVCAAGLLAAVIWKICNHTGPIGQVIAATELVSVKATIRSGPTDADIFHCRMFAEPLVPIGGETTPQENAALLAAIEAQKNSVDQDDHSAVLTFLDQNPNSAWRAALLTNLGLEYRHTGWFLKALDAWEKAWATGKNEKSQMGRALMDRTIGELAELNARLGRLERVEAILKEISDRPLLGPATEKITAG